MRRCSKRADAIQLTLELLTVEVSERQCKEGLAACFDAGQRGVECSVDRRFLAYDIGRILQSPVRFQRRAEIHRAAR